MPLCKKIPDIKFGEVFKNMITQKLPFQSNSVFETNAQLYKYIVQAETYMKLGQSAAKQIINEEKAAAFNELICQFFK